MSKSIWSLGSIVASLPSIGHFLVTPSRNPFTFAIDETLVAIDRKYWTALKVRLRLEIFRASEGRGDDYVEG
jgi:hypothetical protein